MDASPVAAHGKLDRLVDRAFGAKKKVTTTEERARVLFEMPADLTAECVPTGYSAASAVRPGLDYGYTPSPNIGET
nr:hypothetical protein [uncultured Brachybacterium sp.]